MAAIVVRNIPEETHRALKALAKAHGRSTEAEIRNILEAALQSPAGQVGLGTQLAAFAARYGGIELDIPPRTEMVNPPDFDDRS